MTKIRRKVLDKNGIVRFHAQFEETFIELIKRISFEDLIVSDAHVRRIN